MSWRDCDCFGDEENAAVSEDSIALWLIIVIDDVLDLRVFVRVVATGSLCLLITLVLAWCLVGVRSSSVMKRVFPSYQNLLKAHIDYLMMTGLLMIVFLLDEHFGVLLPPIVVFSMCAGSFMNPIGFIASAA